MKKFYYLFLLFIIGCVSGYLYEEVFYLITEKNLYNQGILYGPWLPIYGCGALLLLPLKNIKNKKTLVFILSIFITGILEYIIGYISVNYYKSWLWDYNGLFLNINGLVCLRSVLSFAILGCLLIYVIEPNFNKIFNKINYIYIKYISVILIIIFITDIILSNIYRTPRTYN